MECAMTQRPIMDKQDTCKPYQQRCMTYIQTAIKNEEIYHKRGCNKMVKSGRRSFLKLMGQSAAVLYMGLSHNKLLAQTGEKASKKRSRRITVEEHITSEEYTEYMSFLEGSQRNGHAQGGASGQTSPSRNFMGSLENIDLRLKDMDEAGIDMQILSWSSDIMGSNVRNIILSAEKINNILAETVNKYPNRFAALSTIPWQDPTAAVAELERAVKELGLKGIKMDGTIEGRYLDDKQFRPVLKKAEELGIPIFIHMGGGPLTDAMRNYTGNLEQLGMISINEAYVGELDVSAHAVHMIGSGLFDECPKLKFILGHMGAGLPFWSIRLNRGGKQGLKKLPSEYIKENFYYVTSGNLTHGGLVCCCMSAGADRVLFGVDFPTDSNKEAVEFMETAPVLSESDKEKIYHLNAERLFGISKR